MNAARVALAAVMALIVSASGIAKLKKNPHVVTTLHDIVRVPMGWLPWLAACELVGALGLLLGLAWAPVGIAASIGLVLYFVGAVVAHLRVGDVKGLGPAVFLLGLALACLVTRTLG